jgi:glycerophosphoryl diester phosphodiesterase
MSKQDLPFVNKKKQENFALGARQSPLIIGHRGARGESPENTVEGFLHAQNAGVDGIETDIAMTADLIPVMHHDAELPDGRLIRDLPLSECFGIPTLAESLAALPEMTWLLEIKTYPPHPAKSHPPAFVVARVLEVLDVAAADPSRIAVKAFDWAVLREVAKQRPALTRICLTAPETEKAKSLWWGRNDASAPQAAAASGAKAWSAFHKTLTAAQIAEAKSLGLMVFAWTVNEPADFDRLSPLVDGIVTDVPSRFMHPASSWDGRARDLS